MLFGYLSFLCIMQDLWGHNFSLFCLPNIWLIKVKCWMNEWVRNNGCPWSQDAQAPSFIAPSGFNAPSTTHSFTPQAPSQTQVPSPITPSPPIPLSTARISALRNNFCLRIVTRHQFICFKPNLVKDGRLSQIAAWWVEANKMQPAWQTILWRELPSSASEAH